MRKAVPLISLVGGGAAFGASGAVLGAARFGVPFLPAALVAACCAGLLVHAAIQRARPAPSPVLESRVQELEETAATLRHDLRGVLSPALMLSERLLRSEDPAVRRAGQVVVRSVERAVDLLGKGEATAGEAGAADAAASPARSPVAGIGAPGP